MSDEVGQHSILMQAAVDAVEDLRRQLRWFWWVMAALAVIIILLIVGYFQLRGVQSAASVTNQRQAQLIAAQHAAQVAGCQSGNAFRADDAAKWDKFLAVALGRHPNAHALAAAAQIRGFVHASDKPRDCSKL